MKRNYSRRRSSWPRKTLIGMVSAAMLGLVPGAATATLGGVVSSVDKAPISPTGDVAGELTDLVITLDTSLDPAVPGRSLRQGDSIKVTLPDAFTSLDLPTSNVGPGGCNPASFSCNTGVLLQGWPQNPIPPTIAAGNYLVSMEGTHTIVFTAVRDLLAGDPTLNGPGIKQVHLLAFGFVNPHPGRYGIEIDAETGIGGAVETGTGFVAIRPDARASVNVTSVFAGANTIYQETAVGTPAPHAWDFLVWDRLGGPAVGITVDQIDDDRALLRVGESTVGQVKISAPPGAAGQAVSGGPSSLLAAGPILGLPTGRLTITFIAGHLPGTYETTLSMLNGTSVTMYVEVTP